MQQHLGLAMRVAVQVHFEPTTDRDAFAAIVFGCLEAVGGKQKLLGDPALELLFRSSRGVFRVASRLLRASLRVAHDKDQSFIDEHVMQAAVEQMFATSPAGVPAKA
jgi:Holliday junction resolvasome RuvABC ATP-dependent DNA helicase subunit